jgi:XTP/dITP diphosphohydrolase
MKKILYFVTGNAHKFQEVKQLIESSSVDIEINQSMEPLMELQADSLEEVAQFKAQSVVDKIDSPFIIEDAGFFVEKLHGFPGVYSSYIMKAIGWQGILKLLEDDEERSAFFKSVIAFVDVNKEIHLFIGENHGCVSMEGRGESGFGFDPIFLSEDNPEITFAEMNLEEKNMISHRSRSMQQLIEYLNANEW